MEKRLLSNTKINDFILEFINSDINKKSYEEIRSLYFEKFKTLSIPTLFFQKEFSSSLTIFRARPNNKIKNIYDYSEFSSPPINKKNGFGRCNWNGCNVFYGSDNFLSSLKETKEEYKKDNEFYVGEWAINYQKINNPIAVSSFLSDEMPLTNPWSCFLPKIKEFYNSNSQTEVENLNYLNKRLADLFIQTKSNQYRSTAFISHQIIFGVNKNPLKIYFPILLYPSVESNSESCNFAIHPAFTYQYMTLSKVYHIKINEKNKKGAKIDLLKVGFVDNKKNIDWFNISINIYKILHRVESVYCDCGKEYSYKDLSKIKLLKNNKEITLDEIINQISSKNEKYLTSFDNNIPFPKNEIPKALEISIKQKYSDLKIIDANAEHSNITFSIKFLVPIIYEKYKL